MRWVVIVLEDVEAGDARLLHAVARVFDGGGFEGVDRGGVDVDVDVDDEHWRDSFDNLNENIIECEANPKRSLSADAIGLVAVAVV